MAVTRKIISIEQQTITVPIGETITLGHLPNILYVNYNVAPFHGYITFDEKSKRELLVLNPRSGSTATSSVTRNTPEKIMVDPNGVITNIPTDIQQEVLLKGGIKNGTQSNPGGGKDPIMTYEPLVFYISILVGGIDWRPASRFPAEIDLIDANMKEPATSSDLPAIDAYQYLISLQTRSQAEDYQLESLKQSLAKKMILARDVNYLGACILAVEREYFELIQRLERLEKRVDYIEKVWLPELEGRLFTSEINIKNIWDNLVSNWNQTSFGLYAARHDAYWRVHAALRHYGSTDSDSSAWPKVDIFGDHGKGPFTDDKLDDVFTLVDGGGYPSYYRTLINPETGSDDTLKIIAYDPTKSTIEDYKKHVYGLKKINGAIDGHFFHLHVWNNGDGPLGDRYYGLTSSGDNNIFTEECFHNIIVKNSIGSAGRGAIITQDHIGYYYNLSKDTAGRSSQMVFKVSGSSSSGLIELNNSNSAISSNSIDKYLRFGVMDESHGLFRFNKDSNEPYVFVGMHNRGDHSTGFTVQPEKNDPAMPYNHSFITGDRIFLADMDSGNQYINFAHKNGYTVMNFGNGKDGFYIGKTDKGAIIEYEVDKGKYCGLAFTAEGLKFYGISQSTLDQLKAYINGKEKSIYATINSDPEIIKNISLEEDPRMKNIVNCNCGKRSNE